MYSIFYIDVGIYIVSGNPCGMSRSWPAESRWDPWWNRWDPRRDFTQDCGLPQVGSRLGSHPKLVGSHPRRSIIPVGIPPGIKTGSRLGSHPRLAGSRVGSHPGSHLGLRQDPAWDPTQDWRDPGWDPT